MSEPMSQAFANAFITTCFEEGLSEDAAAALLQKESVDRIKRESPAWASGYDEVMQVPLVMRWPGRIAAVQSNQSSAV